MAVLDDYRVAITEAVEAQRALFTEYPLVVEYDNRDLVDMSKQTAPFLCCEIQFFGGGQMDLSERPFQAFTGLVILTAKVKAGGGSAAAYKLVEHFYRAMQHRDISGVKLQMASIVPPKEIQGWWGLSAVLPFRINQLS